MLGLNRNKVKMEELKILFLFLPKALSGKVTYESSFQAEVKSVDRKFGFNYSASF